MTFIDITKLRIGWYKSLDISRLLIERDRLNKTIKNAHERIKYSKKLRIELNKRLRQERSYE